MMTEHKAMAGVYRELDGGYGKNLKIGARVELHPGLDLWMRGARYGVIVGAVWSLEKPGAISVYKVKMDHRQVRKLQRVKPEDLRVV